MAELKDLIKKERGKAGLTQNQLVAKCNGSFSHSELSKWENGRGKPGYDNLVSIKSGLGCELNDLDEKASFNNKN